MPVSTDTIAALATPTGTSAIAVIRVSGSDTIHLLQNLWGGGTPPPRRVRRADYHNLDHELLDDVLYVYFQGPHSYTGEDSLEVSCHGNPFIAQRILEDLFKRGCRPAEPGEFTQRAFLSGRMDLSQAEAVMDLIQARSDRALNAANQQLRGALGRRMTGLIDSLLMVLARVEAYIDFPDEDLPAEDRRIVATELRNLQQGTDDLLATQRYGDLLRDGIKTVIVGKPNVGKSSLLNRLVGKERALVSAEPGTTRDFIEERVIVGPHCLRFIDTAGLNPSPAPLERLGIEKTYERAAEADLFLVVFEPDERLASLPAELRSRINERNSIIAMNKSDLRNDVSAAKDDREIATFDVSAKTGAGMEAMLDALVARADALSTDAAGEMVTINARHAHALSTAKAALESALANLAATGPVELLASDLRAALNAFGEIAGRVDNERMLDALFATFCIGK